MKRHFKRVFFAFLCLFCIHVRGENYNSYLLTPTAGGLYEAQEIPMPVQSDFFSIPTAINNQGLVVGHARDESGWFYGNPDSSHMYLYENGVSEYIGNGFPQSINDLGQVVGNYWPYNFIYENGQMTPLDMGYERLFTTDINNNETVVGYSDGQAVLSERSFYYNNGLRTDFNIGQLGYPTAINDYGIIVGKSNWSGGQAYIYENGTMKLISGNGGAATDINNNNQVVGYMNVDGVLQAFLWENDTMTMLGNLGTSSYAEGININGSIVGHSATITGDMHAFLYRDGTMLDLNSLISNKAEMFPYNIKWFLYSAKDINDSGTIIAYGPVPEPVIEVAVDIKPGSCPNPVRVNFRGNGVIPVAILGTEDFDVLDIDVATIALEGVSPFRSSFDDVSTPSYGEDCECNREGADGLLDLTLKFKRKDILAALGDLSEIEHRTDISLTLTAMLMDEETTLEGSDCVRLLNRKQMGRSRGRR